MNNETKLINNRTVRKHKNKNKTMKTITRHNKQFVYEYELTPKRKFWKRLETFVNWGLLLTFGSIILGGVGFAIVNLFIN